MKVQIVYASMTGNDEDMAEIFSDDLTDAGFEVESTDVSFADAAAYQTADLCVFVTYTYGEGVMTDEVADFYEQLKGLDLTGKQFFVMGSGDKSYKDHYCETVDDMQAAFKAVGAQEIAAPIKIENAVSDEDMDLIDQTAAKIADQLNG